MAAYTHSGVIKFIFYTETEALVEETPYGDSSPRGHELVRASFSGKVRTDTIDYNYSAMSSSNDGHDIAIV